MVRKGQVRAKTDEEFDSKSKGKPKKGFRQRDVMILFILYKNFMATKYRMKCSKIHAFKETTLR